MKLITFSYLLLFLLSCSQNNEETFKLENKEIIELTTNKIDFPDSILVMPMQLSLVEDSLVILKIGSVKNNFVLFDLRNKQLFEFGVIGQGPNEVSNWVVFNDFNASIREMQFVDMQRSSILKISLDSILTKSAKHFSIGQQLRDAPFRLMELEDGTLLSTGPFTQRLRVTKNSEESFIIDYPFRDELFEFSHNVLSRAYQGEVIKHPILNKYILYTFTSANLDIFEFPYNQTTHIKRHYWKPDFEGEENGVVRSNATMTIENKGGFSFGAVNANFIYLISPISLEKYTDVIIYDWEGNQHETLRFDTKVNAIAVTSDGSKIFAIEESSTSDLIWAEILKN